MMGEQSPLEKAKKSAFRFLALRARSEKELRVKLKEKGFDASVVDEVVGKFHEWKILDDESFARQWARHMAVNKLLGNRRIELSLREKGIPLPMVKDAIAEVRGEISEADAVAKLIRKKVNACNMKKMNDGEKRKIVRNLMSKGFSADLIFDPLKQFGEDFVNEGE